MLSNLKKEMETKEMTYRELGELLGITERSVYSKINEHSDFVLSEIRKIRKFVFPQFSFDYLFKSDASA